MLPTNDDNTKASNETLYEDDDHDAYDLKYFLLK